MLPKNAVLNMVWMFALCLLVFGISGSSRISIPVSSVILYVISLAEAFVVSFRSRPIMMGDVLAVKTAMTVAGSYNYTPTFMMIICGILLIMWGRKKELPCLADPLLRSRCLSAASTRSLSRNWDWR